MILNAGRPGFSLARDDLSQKKQQFRRSLVMMGGYGVRNNSICRLPIISSSSLGGSHSGCHVFGSGCNQSKRLLSSFSSCSGGGHGGGRRNFKVLGGGGNNEEDKSQPSGSFLRTIRKRLEAKALKLHKEVEASVKLLFTFRKALLESKRLDAEEKTKALELHDKLEATVKMLLAESNPRLKSTRSEAGEKAKALKLHKKAEPTVEKMLAMLADQMLWLKSKGSTFEAKNV